MTIVPCHPGPAKEQFIGSKPQKIMEEIKIVLNEQNQIVSPQFHDSEINKIIFLDDEVKIYFQLVNRENLCVSFSGSYFFCAMA